jgi:iron complex transport system substrate-binding protein
VRIVSLLPSATEIVYALGLGNSLVGVTHECDFPPEARGKPVLTASALADTSSSAEIDRHVRRSVHQGSSLYTLDADLLEALAPDLIITQELCAVCAVSYDIVARAAKRLRCDPRVVSLEPSSLGDMLATIRTVGDLTGTPDRAGEVVAALEHRIGALAAHAAGRERPRTLVLEWTDPPMSAGHWTPELVELAGGTPLLAHPGRNSQTLEWETIAAADPDVVLVAPCGFDLATTLRACEALRGNRTWSSLRALQTGRTYAIDGNAFVNRPGPRLVEAAEIFATALHGAAHGAGKGGGWQALVA